MTCGAFAFSIVGGCKAQSKQSDAFTLFPPNASAKLCYVPRCCKNKSARTMGKEMMERIKH